MKNRSQAKALKRYLSELEAEVIACSDPVEQKNLAERAEKLRSDLEDAGYIQRRTPLPRSPKKTNVTKPRSQHVDPLVRAGDMVGKSTYITFVQGGAARGK